MRILGIDYGTRRMGLALSDEEGRIAFPYKTLEAGKKIFEELGVICKENKVDAIVIGLPQDLSGNDTAMTSKVREFTHDLKQLGYTVDFEPEFFSTKEAARGPTKKENIDAAAAAILLQSYLERKKNMIQ